MSEQATSGPTAEPDPRAPASTPVQPPHSLDEPHKIRVTRSEDLPKFSIGTPVAVGMVIWLVLLAAAIWRHDQLEAAGHGWWVWTAVTGVVLGLLGWLYITVRLKDLPGQVVEPDSAEVRDS